jgi:proline iminopeptidase
MQRILPAILLFLMNCTSTTPSTGTIASADGVSIWYRTAGSGPPLVIVHGGPGMDHGSLAADLVPLSKTHRLIFYDQRGGGRSTLPDDPKLLAIEHSVADLEALRLHFGFDRMTLVAHSFGPAVAALYALEHPDRVERMVFLGPIPPAKTTFFEDYGAALSARLTPGDLKRLDELNASFASSPDPVAVCREYWKIATPPRVAKSISVSVVKSDLCAGPAEAIRFGMTKTNPATFGSLGDWDWRERLHALATPTLVIHGEEDAIPMALVRDWSLAMPDARLMRLAETGHFPHAERPGVVLPAIEQFLGGSWPSQAIKEH